MENTMRMARRPERTIPFADTTEGMAAGMWYVPIDGFNWIDNAESMNDILHESTTPEPDPWLVANGQEGRRYAVLRRIGLLEAMDRLAAQPSQGEILRFANRWGPLGREQMIAVPITDETGSVVGKRGIGDGESLRTWRDHLLLYGDLRRLWRAVTVAAQPESWSRRAVDDAERLLRGAISWTTDGSANYHSRYEAGDSWAEWRQWIFDVDRDRGGAAARHLRTGDNIGAAHFYVHRQVNAQLSGHVSPAVLPFLDGAIRLFPDSLAAAAWMRSAFELSGGMGRQRECAHCGMPFAIRRRDQRYCGKHCQEAAAYRRRVGLGSKRWTRPFAHPNG